MVFGSSRKKTQLLKTKGESSAFSEGQDQDPREGWAVTSKEFHARLARSKQG